MTRSDRPVTEDDLQAWVDDLLPLERRLTVENWLNANPDAYQRVEAWRAECDLLRLAMDAELRQPVPARFDVTRLEQRRHRRFSMPQMAASIVLALSIGIGGGWLLRDREVPLGLASVEQEATIVHEAGKGGTIATGNIVQLAAWGERTLGRQIRPPDLSVAGYQLAGGQLVTTDHGPACVFFYKDGNGSRISLFVRPMYGHDMTAPMRPMRQIPGYIWAQDGLGISMVADTPDGDLHRLANHARDMMGEAG